MKIQATADHEGRYAWIESVLRRFEYRRLPRTDRGPVLAYRRSVGRNGKRAQKARVSWLSGGRGVFRNAVQGRPVPSDSVSQAIDLY